MELIRSINSGSVWIHAIRDWSGLPELPFEGKPYLCLLINFNERRDRKFMDLISKGLILSNCRYMCCAGIECGYWHDWIDETEVELKLENPKSDLNKYHLLTTWHDKDEIAEIIDFVFEWGLIDDKHPEHYLIMFLGENPEEEKRYIEEIQKYA